MAQGGRMARWLDRLGVPRRVASQAPLAAALADHLRGDGPVDVRVLRGEGFSYEISSHDFFGEGALAELDAACLAACRGRVLDVGAGAGRHALLLQARGHPVVAIDVEPGAVEVMRARGVEDARIADVFRLGGALGDDDPGFDTVIFLMQSIGIAGSLFGLERLLLSLQRHMTPEGRILLDSSPLEGAAPGAAGEIEVRFAYRNLRGERFPWIYIDERQLAQAAARAGLRCEIMGRAKGGDEYLACLSRGSEPARRGDS
jgi:SAM-dependent methyltransferase